MAVIEESVAAQCTDPGNLPPARQTTTGTASFFRVRQWLIK